MEERASVDKARWDEVVERLGLIAARATGAADIDAAKTKWLANELRKLAARLDKLAHDSAVEHIVGRFRDKPPIPIPSYDPADFVEEANERAEKRRREVRGERE